MREPRRYVEVFFLLSALAGCSTEDPSMADQELATTVRQVAGHTMTALGTVELFGHIASTVIDGTIGFDPIAEVVVANPDCAQEVSIGVGDDPRFGTVVVDLDNCEYLVNGMTVTGQLSVKTLILAATGVFTFDELLVSGRRLRGQVTVRPNETEVHLEFLDTGMTFDIASLAAAGDQTSVFMDGVAELRRPESAPFELSIENFTWTRETCLPRGGEFAPLDDAGWRVFLSDDTPLAGMADVAIGARVEPTKLFSRCE